MRGWSHCSNQAGKSTKNRTGTLSGTKATLAGSRFFCPRRCDSAASFLRAHVPFPYHALLPGTAKPCMLLQRPEPEILLTPPRAAVQRRLTRGNCMKELRRHLSKSSSNKICWDVFSYRRRTTLKKSKRLNLQEGYSLT